MPWSMLLTMSLLLAPVQPAHIMTPFLAPAGPYAKGHRGTDFAAVRGVVVSPIAGTIAFRGLVAGRPVVTVSSGSEIVELEPVLTLLPVGTRVTRGGRLGVVGVGGHCSRKCVHVGVRINGAYRDGYSRPHLVP